MKKPVYALFCLLLILSFQFTLNSQVSGDDLNGRLYWLCKAWGFVKYHHSAVSTCKIDWDSVLVESIRKMNIASNNEDFNTVLTGMLRAAGPMERAGGPIEIPPENAINMDFTWINSEYFSQEARDSLNIIRDNSRPHENCYVRNNDYTDPNDYSWLQFPGENLDIPNAIFPSYEYRLLVLFRYWNIIKYFNPNNSIMDKPWDETLLEFIPVFMNSKGQPDYHLDILRLCKRINDSHAFTYSYILMNYFGYYYPPFEIKYLTNADKTVVIYTFAGLEEIAKGDEIVKIGGQNIADARGNRAGFVPASNTSSLNRDINTLLMKGPIGTKMELEIRKPDGTVKSVSIERKFIDREYADSINAQKINKPLWKKIDCGYGYVDMGRLQQADIESMYTDLKDCPAIVFDIRNYPNGTAWGIANVMLRNYGPFAKISTPDPAFPGYFEWSFDNIGPLTNDNYFKGRIYVLMDETTQSQAEYSIMIFSRHDNIIKIGSQTAGADGNITTIKLPGGLFTNFSTLGVYYPDDKPTQRIGIVPDSLVIPSIEGIRSGRDEVLEKALDCLNSAGDIGSGLEKISLMPNPAHDHFILAMNDYAHKGILSIEIRNLLGNKVFETRDCSALPNLEIKTGDFIPGIYVLVLFYNDGNNSHIKFIKN